MPASGLPAWLVVAGLLLGGGGLAAIAGVLRDYFQGKRVSNQGDRSVAISEVDKAIPGLGEIITQLRTWNTVQAAEIAELQAKLTEQLAKFDAQAAKCALEVDGVRARNQEQAGEIYLLEQRVAELEGRPFP